MYIFKVAEILKKLHMLKPAEMISDRLIIALLESNFRIQKDTTCTSLEFIDRFYSEISLGKYDKYLEEREIRRGFYLSAPWLSLKKLVMKSQNNRCQTCASTRDLQVDHIQSRYKHPELELEYSNCRILCRSCNELKSWK